LDGKHQVEDPVFNPQLSEILQNALEEAFQIQEANGISASLYISERCHWEGATGVTRPDPGVPVEPDMLFGFASITKTFVAAIVLQLVEENKLRLDDPLGKWLEEYPNIDANITIRQLLNHGSGLGSYYRNESFWSDVQADLNRVWRPEELLSYAGPPSKLNRGVPRYTNTNYILLGMIIESVTGSLLEQELQNRIIVPLHLDSTYLPEKDFVPARWADSTALYSSLYSTVWAAGAIASTSKDIAKWSHMLYSGHFLQPTSLASMLVTEDRRIDGAHVPMGLGVWKLSEGGHTAWGHGGWYDPFVSKTFYIPKFELSVAYASSGADGSDQGYPGMELVLAYINNRPDNISMCFDP
jgi:D-alanyl-D-alanine carboxypeptidase